MDMTKENAIETYEEVMDFTSDSSEVPIDAYVTRCINMLCDHPEIDIKDFLDGIDSRLYDLFEEEEIQGRAFYHFLAGVGAKCGMPEASVIWCAHLLQETGRFNDVEIYSIISFYGRQWEEIKEIVGVG